VRDEPVFWVSDPILIIKEVPDLDPPVRVVMNPTAFELEGKKEIFEPGIS
jgi:hypothetical protein